MSRTSPHGCPSASISTCTRSKQLTGQPIIRSSIIVKQAALDRYNRLARHAPHGRLTRGRSVSAREKYAGSYTVIIVNHTVTMANAFHSDRYASGFALARPTLEALMKQALLTAYEGDDDGWQKLVAQNTRVNRHSLKDLAARTRWPDLSQWWAGLAPVLNDFVHGGKGQLLGNPIDEDGWPVYPGDWVLDSHARRHDLHARDLRLVLGAYQGRRTRKGGHG